MTNQEPTESGPKKEKSWAELAEEGFDSDDFAQQRANALSGAFEPLHRDHNFNLEAALEEIEHEELYTPEDNTESVPGGWAERAMAGEDAEDFAKERQWLVRESAGRAESSPVTDLAECLRLSRSSYLTQKKKERNSSKEGRAYGNALRAHLLGEVESARKEHPNKNDGSRGVEYERVLDQLYLETYFDEQVKVGKDIDLVREMAKNRRLVEIFGQRMLQRDLYKRDAKGLIETLVRSPIKERMGGEHPPKVKEAIDEYERARFVYLNMAYEWAKDLRALPSYTHARADMLRAEKQLAKAFMATGNEGGPSKREKHELLKALVSDLNNDENNVRTYLLSERQRETEAKGKKRSSMFKVAVAVIAGAFVAGDTRQDSTPSSPLPLERVDDGTRHMEEEVSPEHAEQEPGTFIERKVLDGEGAIRTLERWLPLMPHEAREGITRMLAARGMSRELIHAAETDDMLWGPVADELARATGLLNREGRSAVIPEDSFFEIDNGLWLVTRDGERMQLMDHAWQPVPGGFTGTYRS